jgi:hypothetical protein
MRLAAFVSCAVGTLRSREITSSMSSIYDRNYYIKIKIEKSGSGSMMSISAGNTLVNTSRLATGFGWADGKMSC